jgi:hypothetical protein
MDAKPELKEKSEDFTLLIAIPSRGEWKSAMAMQLIFMTQLLYAHQYQRIDGKLRRIMWHLQEVRNSLLPQSRQALLDFAIENKFDAMLFIDDDMIFPEDFIFDWLKENRPVIAANCPTRGIPCYPTARQPDPANPYKGKLVYSDIANTRYEKVWRVGTGIMLLRADAMRALPRPAFTPRWEPGNDHYVGEDWAMVEFLEAAGIPVVVDHKTSIQIRHVGDMAYAHEMIKGTRKRIAAESCLVIPDRIRHDQDIEVAQNDAG